MNSAYKMSTCMNQGPLKKKASFPDPSHIQDPINETCIERFDDESKITIIMEINC